MWSTKNLKAKTCLSGKSSREASFKVQGARCLDTHVVQINIPQSLDGVCCSLLWGMTGWAGCCQVKSINMTSLKTGSWSSVFDKNPVKNGGHRNSQEIYCHISCTCWRYQRLTMDLTIIQVHWSSQKKHDMFRYIQTTFQIQECFFFSERFRSRNWDLFGMLPSSYTTLEAWATAGVSVLDTFVAAAEASQGHLREILQHLWQQLLKHQLLARWKIMWNWRQKLNVPIVYQCI